MHQFRSRVSVLLVAVVAMSLLPIIFLQGPNTNVDDVRLALGTMLLIIGAVILLLFGVRYRIDECHLIIKVGPIPFGKIKLDDIISVERSYNPLSSPASSLKRLHVRSKNGSALISPVDEKEFVRLLRSRNPDITVNISDRDDWWRFWDWDL